MHSQTRVNPASFCWSEADERMNYILFWVCICYGIKLIGFEGDISSNGFCSDYKWHFGFCMETLLGPPIDFVISHATSSIGSFL